MGEWVGGGRQEQRSKMGERVQRRFGVNPEECGGLGVLSPMHCAVASLEHLVDTTGGCYETIVLLSCCVLSNTGWHLVVLVAL